MVKTKSTSVSKIVPAGRTFVGAVISTKMQKTATVEWERKKLVQKYERYEKRRTKVQTHIPDGITVQKGDIVEIRECRPISKTKHFMIVRTLGTERLFAEREMRREESKTRSAEEKKEEMAKEAEAK